MEPVPEAVRNTQREAFGAPSRPSISFSFSSIVLENSGVRKYGAL